MFILINFGGTLIIRYLHNPGIALPPFITMLEPCQSGGAAALQQGCAVCTQPKSATQIGNVLIDTQQNPLIPAGAFGAPGIGVVG